MTQPDQIRSVRLEVPAVPGPGRSVVVEVGGVDIASAVRDLRLTAGAGRLTELELDLNVYEVATFGGDARVVLSPSVHEALIALGWTPPGDDAR